MTIRGDMQSIISCSNGDHDKAVDGILDWLLCADVVVKIRSQMGSEVMVHYCEGVQIIKDICGSRPDAVHGSET